MEPFVIRLKCLTPLWLGDIDRSSPAAKESGLIGSLRFWSEGLVRRYGIPVCDAQDRCKKEQGLCLVCRTFGATGWARRFRIELSGLSAVPVFFRASPKVASVSGNWLWQIFGADKTGGEKRKLGANTEYSFGVSALWNVKPFEITIIPRADAPPEAIGLLALALLRAAEWGGLGAKTQYGFGQVILEPNQTFEKKLALADAFLEKHASFDKALPTPVSGAFTVHPDRFFSLLYELNSDPFREGVNIGRVPSGFDNSYIPCSFDIRYKYELRNPRNGTGTDRGLRPAIQDNFGTTGANDLCGFVAGDNARASRIHVSHLFRTGGNHYSFKVWADADEPAMLRSIIHDHLMSRFSAAGIRVKRLV
jgi:CRISPR-associated protein Cmr1